MHMQDRSNAGLLDVARAIAVRRYRHVCAAPKLVKKWERTCSWYCHVGHVLQTGQHVSACNRRNQLC